MKDNSFIPLIDKSQYSLADFFSEGSLQIKIPIIQRDYAQGRDKEKEVRETFLSALYHHLSTGTRIDLDFIYGTISPENRLILLDGQQRLTTLFLLHWYLAHMEQQVVLLKDMFAHEGKSRFTYETRSSSREFCDMLVTKGIDYQQLIDNSIADTIIDQSWFFLSWKYDPSIRSMLTMLDAIHSKFAGAGPLLHLLIDKKKPLITFQFLNLDSFKLTDDLYIKMNARGKPLTYFEGFKANLEQHIGTLEFPDTITYKLKFGEATKAVRAEKYFSHKIDTDWADLFWQYRDETTMAFDKQIMNFFRATVINYVALGDGDVSMLRLLLDKEEIAFRDYRDKFLCLTPVFIGQLMELLDLLSRRNAPIRHFLSTTNYVDEHRLFQELTSEKPGYTERIRFFAITGYFVTNKTTEGIDEWMRIIFNLTENTLFNNPGDFARALQTVSQLLQHSRDILTWFATEISRLSGFPELQIQEERIKAQLVLKSAEWADKVLKMEKHGYFLGQISFLLNFAGIEDYYLRNNSCNWTSEENEKYLADIGNYYQKATSLFNHKGLQPMTGFLFERALLSIGDYLLEYASNKSFLINADRDVSWKRLLRDDNQGKRILVKQLFDNPDFSVQNVSGSLAIIIGKSKVTDWRKYFIETPDLISYLGQKEYIRYTDSQNIYLLTSVRMSSLHAEYRSYAWYCKLKSSSLFDDVIYESARRDEPSYCTLLNHTLQLHIDVEIPSGENKYLTYVYCSDYSPLAAGIVAFLESKGFAPVEYNGYVLSNETEAKLDSSVQMVVDEFARQAQTTTSPG